MEISTNKNENYSFGRMLTHVFKVIGLKTGKRISIGEYRTAISMIGCLGALLYCGYFILSIHGDNTVSEIFYLITKLLSILTAIRNTIFYIRRSHDMNISGRSVLRLLIPFYNIYRWIMLSFSRGDMGPNKYGENPLDYQPKSNKWYWILFLSSITLSIGIHIIF